MMQGYVPLHVISIGKDVERIHAVTSRDSVAGGFVLPGRMDGQVAVLPVKGTSCHFVIRFAHP